MVLRYATWVALLLVVGGCKALLGPSRQGEITLSSETFSESYYIYGYSYEREDYYRFPYQGEPIPDIINEGYRVLVGGELSSVPGFNTPGETNGFALAGEFDTLEEARDFYEGYNEVPNDLQYVIISDTVELFQVWVQKTSIDTYVKLLVKEITVFQGDLGNMNNEVTLEYTYQPNGSTTFPD
jgi:hypothetical protein